MLEEQREGRSSWSHVGKGEVSGGQITQSLVNHKYKLGFILILVGSHWRVLSKGVIR